MHKQVTNDSKRCVEANKGTQNTHSQIDKNDLCKQRIIEIMEEFPPHEYENAFYLISRPELVAKVHETTKDLPHHEAGLTVRKMIQADKEENNVC